MADTSYLKKIVEPWLLNWAAQKIGVSLKPAKVVVGHNIEGHPVQFAFDGVPNDGSIGVCISASISYKVGQMRKFFMEATLLNRCHQFQRRVMIFTNQICWEGFKNQCDGLVCLKQIEPMICEELPANQNTGNIYEVSSRSWRPKRTWRKDSQEKKVNYVWCYQVSRLTVRDFRRDGIAALTNSLILRL